MQNQNPTMNNYKLIIILFYINNYMILNLSYNYLYNEKEKEVLGMVIMNTKLYLISISFYFILYLIILLVNNITIKKILYVIFITDLIGLIINLSCSFKKNIKEPNAWFGKNRNEV